MSTAGYRFKARYEYGYGVLKQVSDFNAGGTVFWQATAADARGNVLHETLGNGAQVISGYSPLTGWIDYRTVTAAGGQVRQDLSFSWDKAGNLSSRTDVRQGNLTESFTYDTLNRLTATKRANTTTDQFYYDALGNLTYKWSVAGSYTYNAGRPYAVRDYIEACGCGCSRWWQYTYNGNGNLTSSAFNGTTTRTVTWTAADQPASITQGTSSSQFSYTPDRQLWRQVASYAGTSEETVYLGGLMEKMTRGGVTEYRHYIPAGASSVAIYTRRSSGTAATYYVTKDHLGSSTTVMDGAGATLVNLSFSAFGQRRGAAWQDVPPPADFTQIGNTSRQGFTGHQQLDNLALVHMNGRVYDPYIQRFMSADPIVDGLGTSQGLNRYGYLQNNPLNGIDPTGSSRVDDVSEYVGLEAMMSSKLFNLQAKYGALVQMWTGWASCQRNSAYLCAMPDQTDAVVAVNRALSTVVGLSSSMARVYAEADRQRWETQAAREEFETSPEFLATVRARNQRYRDWQAGLSLTFTSTMENGALFTNDVIADIRMGWIAAFDINEWFGATIDLGSVRVGDELGDGYWTQYGYVQPYKEGRVMAEISMFGVGSLSAISVTRDNGRTWTPGLPVFSPGPALQPFLSPGKPIEFRYSIGIGIVYEGQFTLPYKP